MKGAVGGEFDRTAALKQQVAVLKALQSLTRKVVVEQHDPVI